MRGEEQIEAALHQLEGLRTRILEMIEWEKLIEHEMRIEREPGFNPHASTVNMLQQDMRDMYGFFLFLAGDIHEALSGSDASEAQQQSWRKRLSNLEQEVRALRVNKRFIKP